MNQQKLSMAKNLDFLPYGKKSRYLNDIEYTEEEFNKIIKKSGTTK
jgi:hypothetical protein